MIELELPDFKKVVPLLKDFKQAVLPGRSVRAITLVGFLWTMSIILKQS